MVGLLRSCKKNKPLQLSQVTRARRQIDKDAHTHITANNNNLAPRDNKNKNTTTHASSQYKQHAEEEIANEDVFRPQRQASLNKHEKNHAVHPYCATALLYTHIYIFLTYLRAQCADTLLLCQ
jgi:hypothetical protein